MSTNTKMLLGMAFFGLLFLGATIAGIYYTCDGRCGRRAVIWHKHCQDMCFKQGYCPMEDR